ncbi:hypothetical protein ACHWQZ_G002615 [Mnemiopsis leidyi]
MNDYSQNRPLETSNPGHFIPVASGVGDQVGTSTAGGAGGHQYFGLPSFAGFSWPFVDHSQEEQKHHTVGFVKPSPRPSTYNVKVERTERTIPAITSSLDRKPVIQNKDKITPTPSGLQVVDPYKKNRKQYRKARTLFSPLQLERLENEFQKTKYLSTWDREKLARYLQITDTQVKTWFQNRRKKWKRTNGHPGAQLEGCRAGKFYGTRISATPNSSTATLQDPYRHMKHSLSSTAFGVVTSQFGAAVSSLPVTSELSNNVMSSSQADHMLFLSS